MFIDKRIHLNKKHKNINNTSKYSTLIKTKLCINIRNEEVHDFQENINEELEDNGFFFNINEDFFELEILIDSENNQDEDFFINLIINIFIGYKVDIHEITVFDTKNKEW